jgi:hypothetical protein
MLSVQHRLAGRTVPKTLLLVEWGGHWLTGQELGPLDLITGLPRDCFQFHVWCNSPRWPRRPAPGEPQRRPIPIRPQRTGPLHPAGASPRPRPRRHPATEVRPHPLQRRTHPALDTATGAPPARPGPLPRPQPDHARRSAMGLAALGASEGGRISKTAVQGVPRRRHARSARACDPQWP